MRTLGKIILIFLFIPLFLSFLLATSAKFQFLNFDFWNGVLNRPGFYEQLVSNLRKAAEQQLSQEGASQGLDLSRFITKENAKSVFEENLKNFLDFANGKEKKLFVTIPKGLPIASGRVAIDELTTISPGMGSMIDPFTLIQISRTGLYATSSWIVNMVFLVAILFLLFALTEAGKRFIALGMALIFGGIFSFAAIGALTVIRVNWTKDLATSAIPGDALLGIVAPPILEDMTKLWMYIAAGAIILGIVLFFFKKPGKK